MFICVTRFTIDKQLYRKCMFIQLQFRANCYQKWLSKKCPWPKNVHLKIIQIMQLAKIIY